MTISLSGVPASADLGEPGRPKERIVIEGASMAIGRGEAVALVGESGSGKSLLAMGAVDLLTPGARVKSGETVFEGRVLQELEIADWRALVGMGIGVLLEDAVGSWDPLDFIGLQSGEVLMEHTEFTQGEIQERVLASLGEVGLSTRRHFAAFVHEMSRGQAQRGMLASALLSAAENVAVMLRLLGVGGETARKRVWAALEAVGGEHRADHRPSELSGGEQQRVALARALVHTPKVILADEPTGELDTNTAAYVLELLHKTAEGGGAVVIATHDPVALDIVDVAYFVKDGTLHLPDPEELQLWLAEGEGGLSTS